MNQAHNLAAASCCFNGLRARSRERATGLKARFREPLRHSKRAPVDAPNMLRLESQEEKNDFVPVARNVETC